MINSYAASGLHPEAENIFQDMKKNSHSPDTFTYLALVRAYTEAQKHSKAEEVIHRMQNEKIPPTCAHFI